MTTRRVETLNKLPILRQNFKTIFFFVTDAASKYAKVCQVFFQRWVCLTPKLDLRSTTKCDQNHIIVNF